MISERCVHCGLLTRNWKNPVRCNCGCVYSTTERGTRESAEEEICADCSLQGACAIHRGETS